MEITLTSTAYREAAWERIKAARSEAEKAGFLCAGVRYDADPLSCQRIASAVVLAMLAMQSAQPYSIEWTTFDNKSVTLDAAGMIAVGLACGKYIGDIFNRARTLRERIHAATTADQLDAIQWTS